MEGEVPAKRRNFPALLFESKNTQSRSVFLGSGYVNITYIGKLIFTI